MGIGGFAALTSIGGKAVRASARGVHLVYFDIGT